MWVAYAVRSHCRKLARLSTAVFRRDFNSSKCKTWAKMTTARMKLLRNKRECVVRQMRRDVALLLQSGQESTARIRVEHVIREQNMMAANEILQLFCDRLVTRLSIISKRKECPADMKEAISSLIFAGPRCSDIPELLAIRDIFLKKYGKDFVSAATDLRPNSAVNRLLIEKLSALNPSGQLKLKVMKEIAKEYQVEWDTTETEMELLKPPEQRIEGPCTFTSASTLPISTRLSGGGGSEIARMNYEDAASAAKAAADSAKNAIAAAQAAAQLSQRGSSNNYFSSSNLDQSVQNNFSRTDSHEDGSGVHGNNYRSQGLVKASNYAQNAKMSKDDMNNIDFNRRHSYNIRAQTDVKFDDSDCDEDSAMGQEPPSSIYPPRFDDAPSNAKSGAAASVHPKLPDYDALTARFEALKYRKT